MQPKENGRSKPTTKLAALATISLVLSGCETVAEPAAQATEQTYTASLLGLAEVPGPGDPDGSGVADITIVDDLNRICYEITVTAMAPATAAHIHRGTTGEAGPPVVTLEVPVNGEVSGCVAAPDAVADLIAANPAGYYVNIHNAEYPGGAIRGQLHR